MTTLRFRVDEAAAKVDEWAGRLQIGRLELLREALQRHLAALAADQDLHAYTEQLITKDEISFAEIADWGPADDGWADWGGGYSAAPKPAKGVPPVPEGLRTPRKQS